MSMRAIARPRRVARWRCTDERGAVAIIVALLLVVIFGFAAYTLDTGNTWQARRHLITATDAAALGAADEYARGHDGCAGTDDALVSANYTGASVQTCARSAGTGPGYVTVTANRDVEWNFARIFGATGRTITASTTAAWGSPLGITGLRPLGLCADEAHLQSWLAAVAAGNTTASPTYRIPYTKSSPDLCGGNSVPGNWGVQDFNGGNNSTPEIRDWLANGYDGIVHKGDWIPGNTGAFSTSLNTELDMLVSTGTTFTLPVFSVATDNGSNATFHIAEFVGVKLVGYKANGAESTRYIDLQFQMVVAQGECCDRGSFSGVSVVHVCSVDHAVFDPTKC
jgi:Flp pilus assembly protein TadG